MGSAIWVGIRDPEPLRALLNKRPVEEGELLTPVGKKFDQALSSRLLRSYISRREHMRGICGRYGAKHFGALACAFVLASASLVGTPRAALADPNQDVGVCLVHATLTFDAPIHATPSVLLGYSFYSGAESCTSASGFFMSWAGNGQAISASCTELVDLVQSSIIDSTYNGITTSGSGTLLQQEWVFQSLNPAFTWTAGGEFVPDTSVYGSPSMPTTQCAQGGLQTISLFGVVTYVFQSKIGF